MNIIRATIFERDIEDNLQPKLILVIIYVKNNWSTRALQNLSSYKIFIHKFPDISQLQILGPTIYIFLHKEKLILKLAKWTPRALKDTLVSYTSYIIYRVYFKNQKKVIQVNDFHIFKDYRYKSFIKLLDYSKGTPIFQGFLFKIMPMNNWKMICI